MIKLIERERPLESTRESGFARRSITLCTMDTAPNENARFVLMNVNCIGKRLSFERNVESQGNVKDWKLYPYMNMTFVPSGPFSRISYEL